jgi:hypothetical protein
MILMVSAIKSVQRGIVGIASGSTSVDVTISAVDLNKSMLKFSNNIPENYVHAFVRGRFNSGTTIGFDRVQTTNSLTISWEVIEYV